MDWTWRVVCESPHAGLFRWYAGDRFFPHRHDLNLLSWPVFEQYAGHFSEDGLANIMQYVSPRRWGVPPYAYVHKRFGSAVFKDRFQGIYAAIGARGTFADIVRFGLEPWTYAEFAFEAAWSGNVPLLVALFKHGYSCSSDISLPRGLEYSKHLSVPLLELVRQQGLDFDVQKAVRFCLFEQWDAGARVLTEEHRALIKYAGWTLPDGTHSLQECFECLFPEENKKRQLLPYAEVAAPTPDLVNSL
jgi:hypothetical protein